MEAYFTLDTHRQEEGKEIFAITLNRKHPVYKGHFPDVPVTPGVVLTDICRQLAEHALDKKLQLKEAKTIKFLAMVNPEMTPALDVEMMLSVENERYAARIVGSFEGKTYFKIQADFAGEL